MINAKTRPALLLLLTLAPGPALRAGEADVTRFRTEYPEAARRLEAVFSRVKGVYRLSTEDLSKKHPDTVGEITFAVDGQGHKASEQRRVQLGGRERLMDHVACVNDKKGFVVIRQDAAAGYSLRGVDPAEEGRKHFADGYDKFIWAPFYTVSGTLPEVMKDPTFQLLSAEPEALGGKQCLKVTYEFGAPPKSRMALVLDPEAAWVIRHGEYYMGFAPKTGITFDVEYEGSHQGVPLPRSVEYVVPRVNRSRCEFQSIRFEGTPRNEFTMASYGLPEITPSLTPPAQGHRVTWLLALGAIGMVIASALRRLADRMEPVVAPRRPHENPA